MQHTVSRLLYCFIFNTSIAFSLACSYLLSTVSESVERAEFLESSSKKYGVSLLMSDSFFNLLDSNNSYRCRKIDQLVICRQEDEHLADPREFLDHGEKMSIVSARAGTGLHFWICWLILIAFCSVRPSTPGIWI